MKNVLYGILQRVAGGVVCPFLATVGQVMGIASAANSLFGSDQSAPSTNASNQAAQTSSKYYDTLANIGQEQWDLFKNEGLPLLRSLAAKSQEDRTAQESDLAAGQTKDTFASARAAAKRALNLTSGDTSDRAAAVLGPSYMDEAAAVSRALTNARRSEQQRQFDQPMQVLNTYRGFPGQATSSLGAAAGGEAGLAGTDAYLANLAAQRQSQGAYGGVLLARNAAQWGATRPATGGVGDPQPLGSEFGNQGDMNQVLNPGGTDPMIYSTYQNARDGGVITRRGVRRYADGGDVNGAGVIRGPGTGTSDSIDARSRPGSFILSADTVRAIGTKKVHELIEKSGVRPGEGGTSYSGVPVKVSNGEAEIPPETVRYHGEDFFHKLQQKYHRPVMSDDGSGHANGGVIRKRGLPQSVEDAIFRAMPMQAIGGRH